MAQAIQQLKTTVKSEEDIRAEHLEDIRDEAAQDADGLINAIKLLQAMNDKGILELLLALFERGDKVMGHLVDVLAKPGAANALQTALVAVQSLGTLNPTAVSQTISGLAGGLDRVAEAPERSKPIGMFELMRKLKDPDVNAAIVFGLDFLQGMGRAVRTGDSKEV